MSDKKLNFNALVICFSCLSTSHRLAMFVKSFSIILLLLVCRMIKSDDVHLLKDYFTTSLIEENREILSQPLTTEIEELIKQKVDGFMSLMEKPTATDERNHHRSKRDILNNNVSSNEESKFLFYFHHVLVETKKFLLHIRAIVTFEVFKKS